MAITRLSDSALSSTRLPPFRNIIINGDMSIAQRGTSSAGLTTGGYRTVDRFNFGIASAGTWTITQDTSVPTGQGFATSTKLNCTTANASLGVSSELTFFQKIEGQNLQYLKKGTANAESVTMSFWVKSNKTGTYTAEIYDNDNNRTISKSYTINSADTWEKKTITFAGDTTGTLDNDNAVSFWIFFWLGAGTNYTSGTFNTSWNSAVTANRVSPSQVNLADTVSNYINITGVQLEAGTDATDFEYLPVDVNLGRCQRYYQVDDYSAAAYITIGQSFSTTVAGGVYYFKKMRTAPTVTFPPASLSNGAVFLVSNGGYPSSAGTHSINNISDTNFRILASGYTGLSSSAPSVCYAQGAAQQVIMSAEL